MATHSKRKAAKPRRRAALGRRQCLDHAVPSPRDWDYTISEWCLRRRVSRFTFYKMLKAGTAPKTMKLNKRRTISVAADAAWQEARERESTKAS
jgi:hypothetical protein